MWRKCTLGINKGLLMMQVGVQGAENSVTQEDVKQINAESSQILSYVDLIERDFQRIQEAQGQDPRALAAEAREAELLKQQQQQQQEQQQQNDAVDSDDVQEVNQQNEEEEESLGDEEKSDGNDNPSDSDDQNNNDAQKNDGEPKKLSGFKRKMQKRDAIIAQQAQRIAELEEASANNKANVDPTEAPMRSNYATDEDYLKAYASYAIKAEKAKAETEEVVELLSKQYSDFRDSIQLADVSLKFKPEVEKALSAYLGGLPTRQRLETVYKFSKSISEMALLNRYSGSELIEKIEEIEERFDSSTPSKQTAFSAQQNKVTGAPKIPDKIKGSSQSTAVRSKNVAPIRREMSVAEHEEEYFKSLLRRR